YIRYYTCQYGLPHTILRYGDIYGETSSAWVWHPLTYFLTMLSMQRRPTIRGTDIDIRDHIFIDDVVRDNLSAVYPGRNETLHISSGQGHTLKQFYQAAAHLLKNDIPPLYLSSSLSEP